MNKKRLYPADRPRAGVPQFALNYQFSCLDSQSLSQCPWFVLQLGFEIFLVCRFKSNFIGLLLVRQEI